jgi:hypothetical protein
VLSALAPSVAGGLPQRLRFVGPQCVAPVLGCTATFFRTTTWTIVPISQFSAAYSAVTLSSVEDDGVGEELRVLLAHSMRGHHTANARRHDRLDPVG